MQGVGLVAIDLGIDLQEDSQVIMDVAALRHELDVRGWRQADLVRASGLNAMTISRAAQGRTIAPSTARAIANALSAEEPFEMAKALVKEYSPAALVKEEEPA